MSKYLLTLYITGETGRAQRAISNLRRICDDALGDAYELVVVDVLEQPERAEEDRIVATPTLVKRVPPPTRRVIGDMSNLDQVLLALDLQHAREARG